jgi:uncharacterized protein
MKLLLRAIPEGHSVVERDEPPEPLELDAWCSPRGPVHVRLDADRRAETVTLRGTVSVQAVFPCARCLRDLILPLEGDVLVLADRRGADDPRDERALEAEGSVLYHEGLEIDLGPSLREALILEVPQVVLCRDDCAGLCPQCGQDRNEVACGCEPQGTDPRWGPLRDLKSEGRETR